MSEHLDWKARAVAVARVDGHVHNNMATLQLGEGHAFILYDCQYNFIDTYSARMQCRMMPKSRLSAPQAIDALPEELLLHTLSHLDAPDLMRASRVSHKWNRMSKDNSLWESLCRHARIKCDKHTNGKPHTAPSGGPTLHHLPENRRVSIDGFWYRKYKDTAQLHRNWSSCSKQQAQLPQITHAAEGHTDSVYALQISGDYLVSGSLDRTVRIWDLRSCRLLGHALEGHLSGVLCLHVDRNQDIILSGGEGGDLISWRLSSQSIIRLTSCAGGSLLSVKLNSRHAVTSSADDLLRVWDVSTFRESSHGANASLNRPRRILDGHSGRVNAIDLSGDILASVSGDHTVKLWDLLDGSCLKSVREPRSLACVSLDSDTLVCGGTHRSLAVYNRRLHTLEARLHGHRDVVRAVKARIGTGFVDRVVSGSYDGAVRLWTRHPGQTWTVRSVGGSTAANACESSSAGGRCCASEEGCACKSSSRDGDFGVEALETDGRSHPQCLASAAGSPSLILGVDMDERRLAYCTTRSVIYCLDFSCSSGQEIRTIADPALNNNGTNDLRTAHSRVARSGGAEVRTRSGRVSRRPRR